YHTPLMGLRHAMEAMLTGDSVSGVEAARTGWANRAYPPEELEEAVLEVAVRVAGVPPDLAQINKRMVHRAFDVLGGRSAIRSGQEFQALAAHQESVKAAVADLLGSVKRAIGDDTPTDAST
ncbi:MAG: enoyl-CoA hydratase, partial [Acidimicrobiaceae bacterium]|nr:enoyl-CoA hydratase [Acidimicrobiaceae bacterium]